MAWEAKFLAMYDYAWNQRCNRARRHLQLQVGCCCFYQYVTPRAAPRSSQFLVG